MKKFASLLMATSVLACSQAFAFNPVTDTPELVVTLSGASAQDAALLKVFTNQCDSTKPFNIYTNTANTANINANKVGDYNAYACSIPVANLTIGNLAARDTNADGVVDVVLYKRSAGGSGEAPNGICGGLGVTAQITVDATCIVQGTDTKGPSNSTRTWSSCAGTHQAASDGGLLDLELNKFPAPYNTVCSTAGISLNATPIWGTIFNTPVSKNFRNALQCAQGLSVGAEDEANMPSLPKSVIASVFNGGIVSWDKLQAQDANGNWTTLAAAVASKAAAGQCPNYTDATPATAAAKRVIVCRRPPSSGTNTQFRVKILNAPCTSEAQDETVANQSQINNKSTTPAQWNALVGSPTSAAIIEASGGGDEGSCLSAFADPSVAKWAIGHQSLENNVNGLQNYRFIKIDGAAPTVANVLTHKYNDWVESNWVWPTAITPFQTFANPSVDFQDAVDFQKDLLLETGKSAQIAALIGTGAAGTGFQFSFGASGLVALNTVSGNVPSLPVSATNPVATSSHGSSSCRTPQVKVNTAF